MIKSKNIFCFLLLVFVLCSLFGCGKSNKHGSKKSDDGRSYGGLVEGTQGDTIHTAFFDSSIKVVMFALASALELASELISLATTANPFPLSPALAASIEAFSAKRLVSSAIDVIISVSSAFLASQIFNSYSRTFLSSAKRILSCSSLMKPIYPACI